MDPITLIVSALAAGAALGVTDTASAIVSKSASQGAWGSYCAVGRPELGRIGDGPFGHTELSSSPS